MDLLNSFKCHECKKKTLLFVPKYAWGWRVGDKYFCTYSCMRKYTNRKNITIYCR